MNRELWLIADLKCWDQVGSSLLISSKITMRAAIRKLKVEIYNKMINTPMMNLTLI